MKISYLFHEPIPELADLDRRMGRLAELGYAGIELTATYPWGYTVEQVAALSEKHRLPVVSLLSGWSYANEGLCLSSPDSSVRVRAIARLGTYLEWAAQLNAIIVMGMMQGLRSDEPDGEVANERIADCLGKIAQKAEAVGTTLVIEPVNHYQVGFNNTAAEAAAMAKRVGSPRVGYMLDSVHMNIEERSILKSIAEYGGGCGHFHLCETNGGLYGTGGIDFAKVLAALRGSGYDRWVSLKIYRNAPWEQSAVESKAFLQRLGEWPSA